MFPFRGFVSESKFFTNRNHVSESLLQIEAPSARQFLQTRRTLNKRLALELSDVIRPIHQTNVIDAMPQSKNVRELVRQNFASSFENNLLRFFQIRVRLAVEVGVKSRKRENSTALGEAGDAVHKIVIVVRRQILHRDADGADGAPREFLVSRDHNDFVPIGSSSSFLFFLLLLRFLRMMMIR